MAPTIFENDPTSVDALPAKGFTDSIHCRFSLSSGAAAALLEQTTVHALLGLHMDLTYQRVFTSALYWKLQQVDVLFIEEFSMISRKVLETIDQLLRKVRRSDASFGGLTVILCGDLYQLPPVIDSVRLIRLFVPSAEIDRDGFCFDSALWELFEPLMLTQNVRHEADPEYAAMLEQLRVGRLLQGHKQAIQQHTINWDQAIQQVSRGGAFLIAARNKVVDEVNHHCLQHQQGDERSESVV